MSGQLPVGTPGTDPHHDHYLDEGPTRLNTTQWAGICRCGQAFRGLTAEDIYAKAQLHINQHQPPETAA
jgi:hypothetical protein